MTYEKRDGDGKEDASEHEWKVTRKRHAARFKDALINTFQVHRVVPLIASVSATLLRMESNCAVPRMM